MATYSRTNTTTSVNPQPSSSKPATAQIDSQELSNILVRSFETVTEALDDNHSSKDIEKAVSNGINNSVLGKQSKSSNKDKSANKNDKDNLDNLLRKQEHKDWKKEQDRQGKLDEKSRKERDNYWNKKVDETFDNINKFSNNPLKGFSNMLDKGVKGLFKGIHTTMDKSLGEVGNDIKKGAGKLFTPLKATGKAAVGAGKLTGTVLAGTAKGIGNAALYGAAGISILKDKITGNRGELTEDEVEGVPLEGLIQDGQPSSKTNNSQPSASMQELLDDDKAEQNEKDKEADKDRDESNERLGELVKGQEDQKKMSELKIGMVLAGIAALAMAIPNAAGVVIPFVDQLPTYLKDFGVKIGALLSGPNSIGAQLKLNLQEMLARMADSDNPIVAALGKPFAYGASEETTRAKDKAGSALKDALLNMGADEKEVDKYISTYGKEGLSGIQNILDSKYLNALTKSKLNKYNKFKKSLSKDDKNKLSEKLDSKQWKEITDEDIQWMYDNFVTSGKMSLDDFENFKGYVDYARVIDNWNDAAKAWDEDKSSKIDFDARREKMQAASEQYEEEGRANWRLEDLQQGKVSLADMQFDKEWGKNETLKAAIQENPQLLTNLKDNSRFENMGLAGQDMIAAEKKLIVDALHDVFGYDIKDKDNSLNIKMQTPVVGALGGM